MNIDICQLRRNYDGEYLSCSGSFAEKKKCPEWGYVLAFEISLGLS
jgi:hypothetical protein